MNIRINQVNQLLSNRTKESLDKALQIIKDNELQDSFYYLSRFGEMLDYLRKFENIEILEYAFLPANLEDINKIEKEIGKALNIYVKQFYQQCGGLFLFWVDKRNKWYEKVKRSYQQDINVDGSIAIYNLNLIFHRGQPKFPKDVIFMGQELSFEDMFNSFHQFDYFSDYRDTMAYTGNGYADNPLLVIGDDHGITYMNSRLIHIPDYLELMFHYCGLVESRTYMLRSTAGHQKPILSFDKNSFEQEPKPDFNKYPYSITYKKL